VQDELRTQLHNEGKVGIIEFEIKHPSGETRIILASLQSITIDKTGAFIATFFDITARVVAERQIRKLASALTIAEQEERHRISQILHDDLQQRIFAVKMQISTLQAAYKENNLQSAPVDFGQLDEWLDESISITRNLSIDLSPAILRGEGLTDALIWLSSQMKEKYGLEVTLQANGVSTRFEDQLRIMLFQAVREALFNIVKHAKTLQAEINLEQVNGHIRITVSDNGEGYKSDGMTGEPKLMLGLSSLRQRLSLMGCDLQVKSEPGNGTQVIIDVRS
jgi:two-component system, chemotaxis family, CheB/CheR fusion protein